MNAPAKVTAVVTNFNGEQELPATLRSLRDCGFPFSEIIVVDDGSTDGSAEAARAALPGVTIAALGRNTRRLNVVRNTGIRRAATNLVFLLDNDILIEKGCVEALARVHAEHSDAAILTPRLLSTTDRSKIYSDGQLFHYLAQTISRNRGLPSDTRADVLPGTSGCGIMLIDKSKAEKVGYFNEHYYLGWGDDGELMMRLKMAGFQTYHVPEAVCYHTPKVRTTQRALGQIRNRWFLILENYSLRSLVLLAPALALFEAMTFAMLAMKGAAADYLRAAGAIAREMPIVLGCRRRTQGLRAVPDRLLFHSGPMYLSETLLKNPLIGAGLRAANGIFNVYWALIRRAL